MLCFTLAEIWTKEESGCIDFIWLDYVFSYRKAGNINLYNFLVIHCYLARVLEKFDVGFCLTVHNRLAYTSRIIAQLQDIELNSVIVVIDDGSRDGTSEYLMELQSDRFHVISGNGQLYWAGGMSYATQYA